MSDIADGINSENAFLPVNGGEPAPLTHHSYKGTLRTIASELEKRNLNDNVALIGHRIVHGDSVFIESAIITDEVVNNIRRVSPLTSLHNYANLSGIKSAQQLFSDITQTAVFDTSFHQTMAPEVYLYGLPQKHYRELGIRRYDFHGTPYRHVSQRAYSLLSLAEDDSGLVVTYLGNDVSTCAVRNDQSVDTSMRMTPLEGLMMDTHSGDVDFEAASWVANQTNRSLGDLERIVNRESGLLGISSLPSDLRVLEKAWHEGHEHAQLAIKTFVRRIARHTTEHVVSLHRPDGIIFTSGIGENSNLIRRSVIEHLAVLGIETDTEMNNHSNSFGERIVSSENARVIYAVVPTNEEKMVALDVIHLDKVNAPTEFA